MALGCKDTDGLQLHIETRSQGKVKKLDKPTEIVVVLIRYRGYEIGLQKLHQHQASGAAPGCPGNRGSGAQN